MNHKIFGFAALMLGATLTGCATSQTEEEFGNSVRATMAEQRMQPQPSDGTTPSGDGQRTESVLNVYRNMVGDPTPVVNTRAVEKD
jgi:hypothetical protein